jgi:hypothetical protein
MNAEQPLDALWGSRPTPAEAASILRKYARDRRLPPGDNNFEDAANVIDRLLVALGTAIAASPVPAAGVTEGMIENAAKAAYDADKRSGFWAEWDELDEAEPDNKYLKNQFRAYAEAALSTPTPAAPADGPRPEYAEAIITPVLEAQLREAEEGPNDCLCHDCGKAYEFDMLVPDDVWEQIKPGKPEGSGLLCPTCIGNQ